MYARFVEVPKGNKTAAEAIDEISAGLSGTAILALGAYLAAKGLITGGGKDDKKEQAFDELQGSQNYALQIGNKSYTIDWAAPVALPLFVGVEIWNTMKDDKGVTLKGVLDSTTKITEPLFNLSMLQGINSTIKSASYNEQEPITAITSNVALSYAGASRSYYSWQDSKNY